MYTYGHSGWSQRLRELAFMNATVLMESSDCSEFFFDSFVPNVSFMIAVASVFEPRDL